MAASQFSWAMALSMAGCPRRAPGPGPAVFLSRAVAAASEKPPDFPVRATPSSSSGRGSGGVSPGAFSFFLRSRVSQPLSAEPGVKGKGGPTSGAFPSRVHRWTFQEEGKPDLRVFAGPFPYPLFSSPQGTCPLCHLLPPPTPGACIAQNVACPPSGDRQVEIYFLSPPYRHPQSPAS